MTRMSIAFLLVVAALGCGNHTDSEPAPDAADESARIVLNFIDQPGFDIRVNGVTVPPRSDPARPFRPYALTIQDRATLPSAVFEIELVGPGDRVVSRWDLVPACHQEGDVVEERISLCGSPAGKASSRQCEYSDGTIGVWDGVGCDLCVPSQPQTELSHCPDGCQLGVLSEKPLYTEVICGTPGPRSQGQTCALAGNGTHDCEEFLTCWDGVCEPLCQEPFCNLDCLNQPASVPGCSF